MFDKSENVSYTIDLLKKQRDILAVGMVILLLISLMLSAVVFSSNDKQVIIPSLNPERSMIYDSNHISKSYYTELALDITHLLLDISPDTLSNQYKRLQMHFLPQARKELIATLRKIKKDVTNKKLSTIFDPDIENIKIIKSKKQVIVPGTLKTLTYNTITSKDKKLYQVTFKYYRNRIYVSDISEIEPEEK